MTNPNDLYREPVALDRQRHRGKRLVRGLPSPGLQKLHACFIAASEFGEASKEYVIAFVDATPPPEAGTPPAPREVSPVVLLGLREDENLYLPRTDLPASWDARYLPAFVRRYPFAYTRDAQGNSAVLIDAAFEGFNDTEGDLLVQDDGEAAPFLKEMIGFLDAFEAEVERTRLFCGKVLELDLLKPVQIDVDLPGGAKLNAGGVQIVDEDKLKALPDDALVKLARSGELGLLYSHLMATTNIQRLTERLGERIGAMATAAA
jgi:SapC